MTNSSNCQDMSDLTPTNLESSGGGKANMFQWDGKNQNTIESLS
jgi:hypothetical protein